MHILYRWCMHGSVDDCRCRAKVLCPLLLYIFLSRSLIRLIWSGESNAGGWDFAVLHCHGWWICPLQGHVPRRPKILHNVTLQGLALCNCSSFSDFLHTSSDSDEILVLEKQVGKTLSKCFGMWVGLVQVLLIFETLSKLFFPQKLVVMSSWFEELHNALSPDQPRAKQSRCDVIENTVAVVSWRCSWTFTESKTRVTGEIRRNLVRFSVWISFKSWAFLSGLLYYITSINRWSYPLPAGMLLLEPTWDRSKGPWPQDSKHPESGS